ncbi:MAG: Na+/H+ antiporter NhaC [Gemmatimonadetes bacterium]|nr:Na+/H+ antiporter NhaC [Gemmatimonadota bacterium]NIO31520.1 Na+/H+ antiporter NhaC [Gemmatimonadota bacterium]
MSETEGKREIRLGMALIPVVFLIGALALVISVYKLPPHMPLIFAAAVAAGVAMANRVPWDDVQAGMVHGINLAMGAILILMVVGTMIGTWIHGGVVPSMIYYGLKVLSPGIFLVATLIICSIVSLGTGSSWSTAGTVGVALIGVGAALSIPLPMTAGAIISGAYFGDKMSPLSDTTNLAPAMAGTDVFTHIRHMIYTTGPGYIIALILYALLGMRYAGGEMEAQQIGAMLDTMQSNFFIHPLLLLPPVLVIVMVVKKIKPLPALLGGTVLGGIFAIATQGASLADSIAAAHSGYVSNTGVASVDDLLSRGGLMSMMETVALIICALAFGGIMERTGMLEAIARSLLKLVKGTGSLITTTVLSCIGMNAVASDQYIAIVIPGRMYKNAFDKQQLHPKNLSRALEDSGTLTSPLIPWNSCGAFMWATLGVYPLAYLPYAFMNLLNPLVSIFYGWTGITMDKLEEGEGEEIEATA